MKAHEPDSTFSCDFRVTSWIVFVRAGARPFWRSSLSQLWSLPASRRATIAALTSGKSSMNSRDVDEAELLNQLRMNAGLLEQIQNP